MSSTIGFFMLILSFQLRNFPETRPPDAACDVQCNVEGAVGIPDRKNWYASLLIYVVTGLRSQCR